MLTRLGHGLSLLTWCLRDLPTRQQTLRDTIAWSYDLLNDEEQRLFGRLGVFVGGFTLEAAEAVCDAEDDLGIDVLDGLESLLSKSLIKPQNDAAGELRFAMLETIREYAFERLDESGETSILRRRHRDWFLALAEEAWPKMVGPEQGAWFARLEADHDNMRAALAWALMTPLDVESGLRLALALYRFWQRGGHVREGRAWVERALALATGTYSEMRPSLLNAAGVWPARIRTSPRRIRSSRRVCHSTDSPAIAGGSPMPSTTLRPSFGTRATSGARPPSLTRAWRRGGSSATAGVSPRR
jgi:predicted ATPase